MESKPILLSHKNKALRHAGSDAQLNGAREEKEGKVAVTPPSLPFGHQSQMASWLQQMADLGATTSEALTELLA